MWFSGQKRRRGNARETTQRGTDRPRLAAGRRGKKVSKVCREMGVSQQAFYSWRRRYAELGLQELRQLREENRKLKGIVADLTLDKHILQEVL